MFSQEVCSIRVLHVTQQPIEVHVKTKMSKKEVENNLQTGI